VPRFKSGLQILTRFKGLHSRQFRHQKSSKYFPILILHRNLEVCRHFPSMLAFMLKGGGLRRESQRLLQEVRRSCGNPKDCCRKFEDPAGILKIAAGSSEILRES
jgi:hypothetical protein